MARAEVYPFAGIGRGPAYPDWIRALRHENGVYVFREHDTDEIVYVGESHTDRLYATLTRHFQRWTNKYETAGATFAREDIDVGVILVPEHHAVHLQDELICKLVPRDNRRQCEELFAWQDDPDAEEWEIRRPPDDYDYDIYLILEGLAYEFPPTDDIPF